MIRLAAMCLMALAACEQDAAPLVEVSAIVGDTLPDPLTDTQGDRLRGKYIFVDRERGHCVLCHRIEGLDADFQGDLGPALTTVGDRLTSAQLRLRIVDYQIIAPGTVMPSYYRNHDLYQVQEAYAGTSILTAQQVEDLVAYLSQLQHEG
ncbi:MAG: sulfur oxidation c-type cytochrome SoxX [Pseudomonadota bacterium]